MQEIFYCFIKYVLWLYFSVRYRILNHWLNLFSCTEILIMKYSNVHLYPRISFINNFQRYKNEISQNNNLRSINLMFFFCKIKMIKKKDIL